MSAQRDARWQALFADLREFLEREKRFPRKSENERLYTWCAMQRLKRKAGELDEEKIQLLDSVNFIWNLQEHIWDQNFALLQKFRRKHPNRWPSQRSRDAEEHQLAVWFLGIRKDFKAGKLAPNRIQRLKEINFPFYPREDRWLKTYYQVENWLQQQGKFPERNSRLAEERKLHNWLRYQVVKMDFELLSEEQCDKLKRIGIAEFRNLL